MFNQENNMNLADRKEVDKIIKNNLKGNFSKKLGDTPTDALQLANKAYVDANSAFAGSVTSGGTAVFLPTGWSVAHTSTGVYTITHKLGTANYAVVVTGTGAFSYGNVPGITNVGSTTCQITMGTIGVGGSVSPTDNSFNFILTS